MAYSYRGRGHQMLRILAERPATILQLATDIGMFVPMRRRQVWNIGQTMLADGLVVDRRGVLYILPQGRDGLQVLDDGHALEIHRAPPTLRVFDYRPGRAA
jgi:hypothetical protein